MQQIKLKTRMLTRYLNFSLKSPEDATNLAALFVSCPEEKRIGTVDPETIE